MAIKKHLEILSQGVDVWNKWREQNQKNIPDLSGADLRPSGALSIPSALRNINFRGANLDDVNLSRLDLRGANFGMLIRHGLGSITQLNNANLCRTDLSEANLYGALLHGANLNRANLFFTNCFGAQFVGANLTKASLTWADLTEAELKEADISEATAEYTRFCSIDLSEVKG
jgi:uncharacterized protein YjbI with pentapeptide repeats